MTKRNVYTASEVEQIMQGLEQLKEIEPVNPKGNQSEYSLEGLMLKLKLQYFGHLMWKANSLENTLMLEKIEGKGRKWVTEDEMVR